MTSEQRLMDTHSRSVVTRGKREREKTDREDRGQIYGDRRKLNFGW